MRAAGFSAKGNVHSIVNKIGEMIEQQYNEEMHEWCFKCI